MRTEYTDRIEIQDVMLKYAEGIDEQHEQLLRSCFAEDLLAPGFREQAIMGIDAWMSFLHEELEPFRITQHMLGPVFATIDGDTAQTRTDLQAMHVFKQPKGQILLLWGTYHTGMVRRDGSWLIQHHELAIKKSTTR
jgi:hypothetical protein